MKKAQDAVSHSADIVESDESLMPAMQRQACGHR